MRGTMPCQSLGAKRHVFKDCAFLRTNRDNFICSVHLGSCTVMPIRSVVKLGPSGVSDVKGVGIRVGGV